MRALPAILILLASPASADWTSQETTKDGIRYLLDASAVENETILLHVTLAPIEDGVRPPELAGFRASGPSGASVVGTLLRDQNGSFRGSAVFPRTGPWSVQLRDESGAYVVEVALWCYPSSRIRFVPTMSASEPFVVGREMHIRFSVENGENVMMDPPPDARLVVERVDGGLRGHVVERTEFQLEPGNGTEALSLRHTFTSGGLYLLSVGSESLGVPVGTLPPYDVQVLGEDAEKGKDTSSVGFSLLLACVIVAVGLCRRKKSGR